MSASVEQTISPALDPAAIEQLARIFYDEWRKREASPVSFEDLPEKERRENRDAAKAALKIIDDAVQGGVIASDYFEETAAAQIHEAWLKRNKKHASPEDLKPFNQLTESEKEKDRIQVRKAFEIYEQLI